MPAKYRYIYCIYIVHLWYSTCAGLIHGEGLVFYVHVLLYLSLSPQNVLINHTPGGEHVVLMLRLFGALVLMAEQANLRDGVEDEEHPAIGHQGDG